MRSITPPKALSVTVLGVVGSLVMPAAAHATGSASDVTTTAQIASTTQAVSVTVTGTTRGRRKFEALSTLAKDGEYSPGSALLERVATEPDYSFVYGREWELEPGRYQARTNLEATTPVFAGSPCVPNAIEIGPLNDFAWCTFTIE